MKPSTTCWATQNVPGNSKIPDKSSWKALKVHFIEVDRNESEEKGLPRAFAVFFNVLVTQKFRQHFTLQILKVKQKALWLHFFSSLNSNGRLEPFILQIIIYCLRLRR